MSGWVKLHRALLEHPCLARHDELGFWCSLLLRAAREPTTVRFRRRVVHLQPGQIALSIREEALRSGIAYRRLRAIVEMLRTQRMIHLGAERGAHHCIVTICGYDEFHDAAAQTGRTEGALRARSRRTEQEEGEEKKISSPDGEEAAPRRDPDLPVQAARIWNEVCGDVLPKVARMTAKRQAALRKRLADDCRGSLDAWRACCQRIRASDFCCGRNGRGWQASIDFALDQEAFVKVIEGRYDNRRADAARPAARDAGRFERADAMVEEFIHHATGHPPGDGGREPDSAREPAGHLRLAYAAARVRQGGPGPER